MGGFQEKAWPSLALSDSSDCHDQSLLSCSKWPLVTRILSARHSTQVVGLHPTPASCVISIAMFCAAPIGSREQTILDFEDQPIDYSFLLGADWLMSVTALPGRMYESRACHRKRPHYLTAASPRL